jgi:hypothetical protein
LPESVSVRKGKAVTRRFVTTWPFCGRVMLSREIKTMSRFHRPLCFRVALAAAVIAVGGCTKTLPQRTLQVSNKAYELDELFTDPRGYTVYRFYDSGDYRYYVVGPNGAQMLPTTRTVTETTTSTDTIILERDHDHGHKN